MARGIPHLIASIVQHLPLDAMPEIAAWGGTLCSPGVGESACADPSMGPHNDLQENSMSSRTYGKTEIVGTSPEGVDAAIRNGIRRASATVRHVDWFEVSEIRGYVKNGEVDHVQVTMKVGFRLEDA